MKVGNNPDLANALTHAATGKPPAKTGAADAALRVGGQARPSGASITLSSSVQQAATTGRVQGDFDAAKVDRVKTAIENGTFQVNAEVVADKLLENASEILAHARANRQ